MPRFTTPSAATGASFGVGRKITLQDLPSQYLHLWARILPEFDRQMVMGGGAVSLDYYRNNWAYDTNRSANAWKPGFGSVPNDPGRPGSRPSGGLAKAFRDVEPLRQGQTLNIGNAARKQGQSESYAAGLYLSFFSRQIRPGLEKRHDAHLKSQEAFIVKRAENIALGGSA